jgi:hypothetical protein
MTDPLNHLKPHPINMGPDAPLGAMAQGELIAEIVKLRNALRGFIAGTGTHLCEIPTYELYDLLPEYKESGTCTQ